MAFRARSSRRMVAVEYTARLVPADGHGDAIGDPGSDEVGDGGVARVVEHEAAVLPPHREACRLARRRPRLLEVPEATVAADLRDRALAVGSVEEIGAMHPAGCPELLHQLQRPPAKQMVPQPNEARPGERDDRDHEHARAASTLGS